MASPHRFQLIHHLALPPETVYAWLTELPRFEAAHPLIFRVEARGPGRYRVHERTPGLTWLTIRYPATFEEDRAGLRVVMRAKVFGAVAFHIAFEMQAKDGGCQVTETVTMETWLPVLRRMEKIFRAQHTQWFHNIARLAQAG